MLLISRHGKTRMNKYYKHFTQKERSSIQREVSYIIWYLACVYLQPIYDPSNPKLLFPQHYFIIILQISTLVIGRSSKLTHFLEWRDYKIVFKRYASLYFVACIEKEDNELIVLDIIHHFVEVLDRYFGNVCELDLIFNFH